MLSSQRLKHPSANAAQHARCLALPCPVFHLAYLQLSSHITLDIMMMCHAPPVPAGTPQAAAAKGSGALGGVAQVAALASSAATAGALLPPALAPAAGAGPAQGGQYNRNTPEPVRRRSVDMLGPGVGSTPRGTGASSGGGAAPAAAAGSGAAAAAALSSFSRIASGRVSNTGMAMMTPPSFSMAGPTRLGSVVNPGSAYPSSNHPSTSTGHGSAAYTSGAAAAAAAAGQALSASALKARAKRVEAGQAFESLYISCLTHLGLSSGDPRLRGWLDAADVLAVRCSHTYLHGGTRVCGTCAPTVRLAVMTLPPPNSNLLPP
jgi:hypothetical protein